MPKKNKLDKRKDGTLLLQICMADRFFFRKKANSHRPVATVGDGRRSLGKVVASRTLSLAEFNCIEREKKLIIAIIIVK